MINSYLHPITFILAIFLWAGCQIHCNIVCCLINNNNDNSAFYLDGRFMEETICYVNSDIKP